MLRSSSTTRSVCERWRGMMNRSLAWLACGWALRQRGRERLLLPVPHDGEQHRIARLLLADCRGQVGLAGQLLPVDRRDNVAALQAGFGRGRAGLHLLHQHTLGVLSMELPGTGAPRPAEGDAEVRV